MTQSNKKLIQNVKNSFPASLQLYNIWASIYSEVFLDNQLHWGGNINSLSLSNTYRVLSVSPYMPNTHSAICTKMCMHIKTMGTSHIASTYLMVEEEGRRDRHSLQNTEY